MIKHSATRPAALLALFLLVPACDTGTDPGEGLGGLDPGATELAVSDLLVPLQSLIEPGQLLRQAIDSLASRGVAFSSAPFDGTARVEFPPEVQGRTFVWDDDAGDWVPDPERTGAPAEGIRVVWYATDPAFDIIVPLDERGYMDLTDQDSASLSRLGLRVVTARQSQETVLADFTQAYDTASTGDEHIETGGVYTDGSEPVTFEISLDGAEDPSTGDADIAFHTSLSTPSVTYTLDQVGTITGSTGDSDQTVTATVEREGVTTTLVLDVTLLESGGQSGSGTLSHDGTTIAEITVNGQRYEYRGTNGHELTTSQKTRLDNLVQTLRSTGLLVFFNLPLLFI